MSNGLRNYKSMPNYPEAQDMHVGAFVGGRGYENCIQFTIGFKYACLTDNQVRDLVKVLQRRLKKDPEYSATGYCSEYADVEAQKVEDLRA